jgi:hypothetical protein
VMPRLGTFSGMLIIGHRLPQSHDLNPLPASTAPAGSLR